MFEDTIYKMFVEKRNRTSSIFVGVGIVLVILLLVEGLLLGGWGQARYILLEIGNSQWRIVHLDFVLIILTFSLIIFGIFLYEPSKSQKED